MNPTVPNQSSLRGNASNSAGVVNQNKVMGMQRWYKIKTLFLSIFSFIIGIPFYMNFTTYTFTVTLGVFWTINKILPLTPGILLVYQYINAWLLLLIARLGLDAQASVPPQNTLIIATIFLAVPGMLMTFFLWITVLVVFKPTGVGSPLWSLGTRLPNMNDFKERQVVDIVAAMALAAGIQTPRVVLLDNGDANAAFAGTSKRDATIVVSRQLLDQCNYEETQGVVAYLVAAISNGDLEIAYRLMTITITERLLLALLTVPVSASSRRIIGRFLLLPFKRGNRTKFTAEADRMIRLLLERHKPDKTTGWSWNRILSWALFPFLLAAIGTICSLLPYFLSNLLFGLIWPNRCFLADATAVRLTGNPDGLASALNRIGDTGGYIPGGSLAAHLFVTWPKRAKRQTASKRWFVSTIRYVVASQSLKNEKRMPLMSHPYMRSRLTRLSKLGSSIPVLHTPIWAYFIIAPIFILLLCPFFLILLLLIYLEMYAMVASAGAFFLSYLMFFGGLLDFIQQLINLHAFH